MHVFTYGTLMFPEVWRSVTGRMFATVKGTAAGYAVFRVREAVFPGMVEAADRVVHGVVYLDVDPAALARLDKFEDDFYQRQGVFIDCDDAQRLAADAYIVPAENRHVLTDEPWDGESFVAWGGLEQFISRFAGFSRIADGA